MLTVDEVIKSLGTYPGDYIVVISHHKGEGALIALAPDVYRAGQAQPIYYITSDRREQERGDN